MTQIQSETIHFPAGNQARLIQAPEGATAGEIARMLELPPPRALLVLNGGTAELTEDLQAQLARLLGDGLARVVAEERITVARNAHTSAGSSSGAAPAAQRTTPFILRAPGAKSSATRYNSTGCMRCALHHG
jgi:hypothetical protein